MSLLGHVGSIVPASAGASPPPDTPTPIHLLVYNAPANPSEAYGPGWTVVAWQDTEWRWSVELAAHGAGARAETRVAKAVAVRVFSDGGIEVESWSDDFVGALPMHRAVLDTRLDRRLEDTPSSHASSPTPGARSARPHLARTGWRRGRSPGH